MTRTIKSKVTSLKSARALEISLYAPVKAYLEGQGYTVKGELGHCDVLARRGDEPPVVVELKTGINLELLMQGVERLRLTDAVYLAVPSPRAGSPVFDRRLHKLLRRLGLGLLLVHPSTRQGQIVEVVLDPAPYRPRKDKRRVGQLLREFARRAGDPNAGGSTGRVKLVTAYRQDALRVASVLQARGPQRPAMLRTAADVPNAARVLRDNVYGWFERVERGLYALTPVGREALKAFAGRFVPPVGLTELPAPAAATAE